MLSETLSWELERAITRTYGEIEQELLSAVIGDLVKDRALDVDSWRLRKLRQLGQYTNHWRRTLDRLVRDRAPELKAEIIEAMEASSDYDDYIVTKIRGVDAVQTKGTKTGAFRTRLDATLKNCSRAMNATNTRALQAMQSQFLDVVNSAYIRTFTGATSLDSALRRAVMDLGGSGVKVDYVSETGVHTRYQLDAAVRRDIVTTVNQSASAYSAERAKDYGTNLVQVSAHSGARPDHARWQGGIYSLEGGTKQYPNLAEVTGYGSVTGLCGANCRHTFWPYFAGYSRETDADEVPGLRENDRLYELQQKQRGYERSIRRYKRQIQGLEQLPEDSTVRQLRNRLKRTRDDYLGFLKENSLTRFSERERVWHPA